MSLKSIAIRAEVLVLAASAAEKQRFYQSMYRTGHAIVGVKTWLSTLEIVYLCLSDETLKVVGPFYLASMPGKVKDYTQGVDV